MAADFRNIRKLRCIGVHDEGPCRKDLDAQATACLIATFVESRLLDVNGLANHAKKQGLNILQLDVVVKL